MSPYNLDVPGKHPRIYTTLGPYGSLGTSENNLIVYVASYTKPSAEIFDTNACGDAYCAAVTMMEWAVRHSKSDITNLEGSPLRAENEMRYFMSVATAAAYSKATNRRGQLYSNELVDMLDELLLGSEVLESIGDVLADRSRQWLKDRSYRLGLTPRAEIARATAGLRELLKV